MSRSERFEFRLETDSLYSRLLCFKACFTRNARITALRIEISVSLLSAQSIELMPFRYENPSIRLSIVLPSKIATALFASLAPQSSLMKFLAPELGPHEVAKEIIAALDCDQGRVVELPAFVKVVWILRRMPRWAADAVIWVSSSFSRWCATDEIV